MGTSAVFGLETPDVDADLDTWGDIDGAYKDALEAFFGAALLNSGTVASQASLIVALPADYQDFEILLRGLLPATSAAQLKMTVSVDGGSTYLAGTNYVFAGLVAFSNNASAGNQVSAGTSSVGLTGGMITTAVNPGRATVSLSTPETSGSEWSNFEWSAIYVGSNGGTGTREHITAGGDINSTTRITHVKFAYSSGNIAAVRWALVGKRGL